MSKMTDMPDEYDDLDLPAEGEKRDSGLQPEWEGGAAVGCPPTCSVYPGSHWKANTSFTMYRSPILSPLLGTAGSWHAASPTAVEIQTHSEVTQHKPYSCI